MRQFRPIDEWPWPLTGTRRRAPFRSSYTDTLELLDRELRNVGALHAYLCLALPESQIRQDRSGPYAAVRPDHPGVMLVTDSVHGDLRYATDVFDRWHDNLRAIALGLEALRKVDRYGITRGGEQYRGFRALPAPIAMDGPTHLTRDQAIKVLRRWADRNPSEPLDKVVRLAKINAHPDKHGGDHGPWNEVDTAAKVVDRG